MSKELRNLTSSYLSDGKRGIERPSLHKIAANAITPRMKTLFLRGAAADVLSATEARPLVPIHSSPNIYLVPHFLSARDLDHLDDLITSRRAAFKHSHTDSKDSQYHGLERTSISMALPKAADRDASCYRGARGRARWIARRPCRATTNRPLHRGRQVRHAPRRCSHQAQHRRG